MLHFSRLHKTVLVVLRNLIVKCHSRLYFVICDNEVWQNAINSPNFSSRLQFSFWLLQTSVQLNKMKYLILVALFAFASAQDRTYPVFDRTCSERSGQIRPEVKTSFNVAAVSKKTETVV